MSENDKVSKTIAGMSCLSDALSDNTEQAAVCECGGNADSMTFDEAMTRLEEIVLKLEGGKQTLEKSIELFEEGTALTKLCEQRLKSAKQKVEILCGGNSDDN